MIIAGIQWGDDAGIPLSRPAASGTESLEVLARKKSGLHRRSGSEDINR